MPAFVFLQEMIQQQDSLGMSTFLQAETVEPLLSEPRYRIEILTDSIKEEHLPNFFYSSYTEDMPIMASTTHMDNWMIFVLLALIFILGVISTYFFKEFISILTAFFRRDGITKLAEEDHAMHKRTVGLIMIVVLFASTLFAYQVLDYYGLLRVFFPIVPLFLQVLFLISGLFGFKILVMRMLGNIFNASQETEHYLTAALVSSSIIGLVLMPVNVLVAFFDGPVASISLHVGIILFGGIYVFSLLSGVYFARRHKDLSFFHIFLYLCTFEFLPVIVIAKTVLSIA